MDIMETVVICAYQTNLFDPDHRQFVAEDLLGLTIVFSAFLYQRLIFLLAGDREVVFLFPPYGSPSFPMLMRL